MKTRSEKKGNEKESAQLLSSPKNRLRQRREIVLWRMRWILILAPSQMERVL
jgi:hypothetical protein